MVDQDNFEDTEEYDEPLSTGPDVIQTLEQAMMLIVSLEAQLDVENLGNTVIQCKAQNVYDITNLLLEMMTVYEDFDTEKGLEFAEIEYNLATAGNFTTRTLH